jgi:hypothetical protein
LAPQYPYGGNVGAGNAYMDAIRQTQLDADAARKIIERGGSTPTRMAAQSPGFFQRLSGLNKLFSNPLIQGSIDVGGRLLVGEPVDEIIPQVGGGMAGSALGAKVGSRFGIPGVLIGSTGGYFLGSYLGGVLDGSIEPQIPMSRTGVSGLTDYLNNAPDRKTEPVVIKKNPINSVPEGYDGYRGPGGAPGSEEITDAELAALNETIQPIVPESVNPPAPVPPRVESGSSAALPGRDSVLSTPNNMQSELLKEATTMRRAKEMKELGITGGDEAMNKGSAMHKWLSIHGQMGNFEAFRSNREEFA